MLEIYLLFSFSLKNNLFFFRIQLGHRKEKHTLPLLQYCVFVLTQEQEDSC